MRRKRNRCADLTNARFGRLTVLRRKGKTAHGRLLWLCCCDCGNVKVVASDPLRNGDTKSCGCFQREARLRHGMRGSAEYRAWIGARTRCTNPNVDSYPYYGGRGIKFLFRSFREFFDCLGYKPTPRHSLDRIDSNGHYQVGNVRWATPKQQIANRRKK